VAIVFAINPVLDMMRTATNVAGQITVPVLVARSTGTLDDEVLGQSPDLPIGDEEAVERSEEDHKVGASA
jgi:Na+/H+-dicarboxylate symporter